MVTGMGHGSIQRLIVLDHRTDERSVVENQPGLIFLPALQTVVKLLPFQILSELFRRRGESHGDVQDTSPEDTTADTLDGIPFRLDSGYHLLNQGQFIGPTYTDERLTLGYGDARLKIDRMDDTLLT